METHIEPRPKAIAEALDRCIGRASDSCPELVDELKATRLAVCELAAQSPSPEAPAKIYQLRVKANSYPPAAEWLSGLGNISAMYRCVLAAVLDGPVDEGEVFKASERVKGKKRRYSEGSIINLYFNRDRDADIIGFLDGALPRRLSPFLREVALVGASCAAADKHDPFSIAKALKPRLGDFFPSN